MPRKVDHRNTKCCICGSTKTYVYHGSSKWISHLCAKKNCTGYMCWNCNRVSKSKREEYFLNKIKERKCFICGDDKTIGSWYKYEIGKGGWDRKSYICKKCYSGIQNNLPHSYKNIRKSLSDFRNGQLSIYSETAKGIIGEIVVAKIRKLDVLSIKDDNFCSIYDLSRDLEYGMIQVKTKRFVDDMCFLNYYNDNLHFDVTFIICLDENFENIERMYIIHIDDIIDHMSVSITKSSSPSRTHWYEKFRIDEQLYNEVFCDFMSFINGRTFFGIEDIKKWFGMM